MNARYTAFQALQKLKRNDGYSNIVLDTVLKNSGLSGYAEKPAFTKKQNVRPIFPLLVGPLPPRRFPRCTCRPPLSRPPGLSSFLIAARSLLAHCLSRPADFPAVTAFRLLSRPPVFRYVTSGKAPPAAPTADAAMARARRRSRAPEGRTERRSRRGHHPAGTAGKVRADAHATRGGQGTVR